MVKPMSVVVLLTSVLLLTACASMPSTLATSSSPLPPCVRGSIPAHGSDCQVLLLGLIPLNPSPSSAQALEKAKRAGRVDVLTDVTVDHHYRWFVLFSSYCTRVDGLGVPNQTLSSACRY